MKIVYVLMALSFAPGAFAGAPDTKPATPPTAQVTFQHSNSPLEAYEAQIGYQRRLVLEEKKALETAYKNRDNSVHIGKDLRDLLAYGISSGFLSYRFLNKTDNLASLRARLTRRNVPTDLQPSAATPPSPVDAEAATLNAEATTLRASATAGAGAQAAARGELLSNVGTSLMRASEAIGAVTLGWFFIYNVADTGHDLVIRFRDTDEIKEHRAALSEAERNLVVADQNLQAAVIAENTAQ